MPIAFWPKALGGRVNEKNYPDVSATNLLAPASDDISTSGDHRCSCSSERRHDTAAACAPTNSYYSIIWRALTSSRRRCRRHYKYIYISWGRRASRATCDFSFYSRLHTQMNFKNHKNKIITIIHRVVFL